MFSACKYSSGYALNGIPYGGKEGDQVQRNLAEDIAMRLLEPYFETGRDMCTGNFFTSYNLAKLLLQENLGLMGTIRRHRREVPGSLNRKMKIYSSKFVFNHVNVLYMPGCLPSKEKQKFRHVT